MQSFPKSRSKRVTCRSRSRRTAERERILSGVRPVKVTRENITPYELDILKRDQFDRKIREIEIRSRNIKRRQKREALWARAPPGHPHPGKGATVNELLENNQKFSNMLRNKKNHANKRNKVKKKRGRRTSIKKPEQERPREAGQEPARAPAVDSFSNTQKLDLVKDEDCREILTLFYTQSKELIEQMRDRMSSSQGILKAYMDRLEQILRGDARHKYIDDDPDTGEGFIGQTILREQRQKYRKLHCMNALEKRLGAMGLFRELSGGAEHISVAAHNEHLAYCEGLSEEGECAHNRREKPDIRTAGAAPRKPIGSGRVREGVFGVQNAAGRDVS